MTDFEVFALLRYYFYLERRSVARRRWAMMSSAEKSAFKKKGVGKWAK